MKIPALAIDTGREAIRNKVLYSILLFACLLTGISAAFGAVSIGDTIKFVLVSGSVLWRPWRADVGPNLPAAVSPARTRRSARSGTASRGHRTQ
jgi:hypothetical protein